MKKIMFTLIFAIFLFSLVSAETSFCCEKLKNGAWCMNAPESDCAPAPFRKASTSCEATGYCRLGTCVNPQEGTCMENTPQRVCDDNSGFWRVEAADEISQCQLGCCLIGDQAAFVTQTRCKRLSSFYGLETNFRTDIGSEFECIASATSDVKGACVFESEFEKTCKMLTKKECQEMERNVPESIFDLFDSTPEEVNSVTFYQGKLCSDETLGTNCGPSRQTTCVEGRDEVFFLDTCGNIANIYDSTKANNPNYWAELKNKDESCGYSNPNVNSASCGNCDYYLGSTCKKKDGRSVHLGDYICGDLSCEWGGSPYEHGETWCADSAGREDSLPGSRHFRLVCYNGDVTIEPCADFRQEICVESEVNGFKAAACKANAWEDCMSQEDEDDCEDIGIRDCKWINSGSLDVNDVDDDDKTDDDLWVCVPLFAPGFNFWEEGDAQELCDIASKQCVVTYEKKLYNKEWECETNCHCLDDDWQSQKLELCQSLGDCGFDTNYIRINGSVDWEDMFTEKKYEGEEE